MKRPIFIAASPNTGLDDVWVALKQLLNPFNWYSSQPVKSFELEIEKLMDSKVQAISFDSARSSLYLLLKAYGIKPGDEVILTSYSCLVIANPVIWLDAKPVYVDINEGDFNVDLKDLQTKVSTKTKAVLIQHTFGLPVDIAAVRKIVGPEVVIIEDLAHALGGKVSGAIMGTQSDGAILTFGIEKVISCVRGGMAITKNEDIAKKLRSYQQSSPEFSRWHIFISLLNPIFWHLVTPIYYLGIYKLTIGGIATKIGHALGLLGNMIEDCEYDTQKPEWLPARLPGALAMLGLHQLKKLDKLNKHRSKIAQIYSVALGNDFENNSERVYLRYPLLVADPAAVFAAGKNRGIVLGDWYKTILYASAEQWAKLGYTAGQTPVAESIAARSINLPTGPNVSVRAATEIAGLVVAQTAKALQP